MPVQLPLKKQTLLLLEGSFPSPPFDTLNRSESSVPASSAHQGSVSQFTFRPVTVAEVHKALRLLDSRKPTGPDNLEPHFF